MQEKTFGTVKDGVVVPQVPLPEGAPVEVFVLGAPLDVMWRLRWRQKIDWLETVVNGEGRASHVERIDPEVPAILRANGAEEAFNRHRELLLKHFPDLVALTVTVQEDREVPGVLWVGMRARLPAETDPGLVSQREKLLREELAGVSFSWPYLVLTHRITSAGE